MKRFWKLAIGLAGLLLSGVVANAQFTSGVGGTVRDAAGAVIPHATITIIDDLRGVSRITTTNDTGYFRFESLAAGSYHVKVVATSFKTWEQAGLVLQAGEIRTLAPTLEVGTQTSTVTVTAQAAAVDLDNADTGTVLQSETLLQTPLVGNNVYSIAAIGPGITGGPTANSNNFGGGTAGGGGAGDNYSNAFYAGINAVGQRQEATNFTLDGAMIDIPSRGGQTSLSPNPEIVQEMQVSVAEYTATKGRNSGANIEMFSKSGTNTWHGSGFFGYTDNNLLARTEFQTTVPSFTRKEYGATVGGPILKGKTFIFGAFSQLREGSPSSGTAQVETQDFANYVESAFPNSAQATFFKVAPPQHYPDCSTQTCTLAGALQGQAAFPDPSIPATLDAIGTEHYSYSVPRNGLQWNVRGDQYFGAKDRIFGNFLRVSANGPTSDARPALNFTSNNATDFLSLDYTHTFTPTLLDDAGFAYTKTYGVSNPVSTEDLPYAWGGVGSGVAGIDQWGPGNYVQNSYQWRDLLAKEIKKHDLKFGYQAMTEGENDQQSGGANRPTYSFQSLIDFAQGAASSLTGTPINLTTGQAAGLHLQYRTFYSSVFAQDAWKMNQRLTVTMGLRYDDNGHILNSTSPAASFITLGSGSTINEQISNASIGPRSGSPNGTNVNFTTRRIWELNPRLGFAYDLFGNGRTAIRGGIGLYTDKLPYLQITQLLRSNLPFSYTPSLSITQNGNKPIPFQLCSPPNGFVVTCPLLPPPQIEFDSHGGIVGSRSAIGGFSPNITTGQVENWSLSVQQQMRSDLVLELDYMGSAGHHLSESTDINRYPGDLVAHNGQQSRLNQSFNTMTYVRTDGNSIANLGSLMLTKRMSHNYTLRGVYTWAKALDYPSSSDDTGVGSSSLVDAQNIKFMRGRADFDVRQRLTIDGVWTLPDPWRTGWRAYSISGWRFGAVAFFQSGTPFSVYTTNSYASGLGDFNADGNNYDYPDRPSFGDHISGASKKQFLSGLFPSSAFPRPVPGSGEGNLGRNTFDEPGYADMDMNAEKIFRTPWLSDRLHFEFRGEVFNLFNRVNLNSVDGNLADTASAFAHARGQYSPRLVQLKIRAQF